MDFHHVRFYVDDARRWADWLIKTLRFTPVGPISSAVEVSRSPEQITAPDPDPSPDLTIWLRQGAVSVALTSPGCDRSPVAQYLRIHPPGIVDVAFAMPDLPTTLQHLWQNGADLQQPIQRLKLGDVQAPCAQVAGWSGLRHTLVQTPSPPTTGFAPTAPDQWATPWTATWTTSWATTIDHAVLNVPEGQLQSAVAWYCRLFGFQARQRFNIQTPHSGLHSQVLSHPQDNAQLPINEPSTDNSQIQTFLVANRGAGIQHIALRTPNLIKTVRQLQSCGLDRLSVPDRYYQQLKQRSGYNRQPVDWQSVHHQQILVDWPISQPQALLLQTFTAPMFDQPTFFWELIERRQYWQAGRREVAQGFGEGNFQALFEAVEQHQSDRTDLASVRSSGESS